MKYGLLIAASLLTMFALVGCELDQIQQSTGTETYRPDLVWGEKGTDVGQLAQPNGVAIDINGNVYVVETANKRVQVFDQDGNYIRAFGGSFDAPDPAPDGLQKPQGIAIDNNNDVWVTDNMPGNLGGAAGEACNRIVHFDSAGNYIDSFGTYGYAIGSFRGPQGLTVNSNGKLYVCDRDNHRVQVGIYNAAGHTMSWTAYGEAGLLSGQFQTPNDVATDSEDNIIVVDKDGFRVQKFDSDWNIIASVGQAGTPGTSDDTFNEPNAVDTDSNDFIYVLDTLNYRVMKFDQGLNFICKFGSPAGTGAGISPGCLNICLGLEVNRETNAVYVSDFFLQHITRFIRD